MIEYYCKVNEAPKKIEIKGNKMRVIYVAGKYTGNSDWETYNNIHHAKVEARKLWNTGWATICPHANSAFFGGEGSHEVDRMKWLEGDFEFIRRSDAIFMLSNYRESQGALEELKLAQELGLEVYYE